MKECPILFSAPMIRALLDGTKTQTRRIVKDRVSTNNAAHIDARPSPPTACPAIGYG